jgi:hypothetical protein
MTCSTTDAYQVDSISLARAPGNHASQATTASRPVLRARYNLLTYSEQFDNAAWTQDNVSITANQTVAPDGTTTADKVIKNTTAAVNHSVRRTTTGLSGVNTISVAAKAAELNYLLIWENSTTGNQCVFDLVNGTTGVTSGTPNPTIENLGNGWFRCSIQASASSIGTAFVGSPTNTLSRQEAGDGTSGIYIWGADLRTGSSAGTYQRIAAATDYATAGFLPYLALVTDDSLSTGSIDFTATDKMSVCAGVTKLSDATLGMLVELGNGSSADFFLAAPRNTATADYAFRSRGTLPIEATSPAAYAAPITNVLTGIGNISGDVCALRVNGTQVAQSTGDQGTGNYSNSPLYIGRRGGSTLPLNGNVYQLIVCGKTLSASELASTESFVAAKTGVAI